MIRTLVCGIGLRESWWTGIELERVIRVRLQILEICSSQVGIRLLLLLLRIKSAVVHPRKGTSIEQTKLKVHSNPHAITVRARNPSPIQIRARAISVKYPQMAESISRLDQRENSVQGGRLRAARSLCAVIASVWML